MNITFSQSAHEVETYDFVEIVMSIAEPTAANPFTDVFVTGSFHSDSESPRPVDGFCDSDDGSVYRIRFMPSESGRHEYAVTIRQGSVVRGYSGVFEAKDGGRRGIVRVDEEHPWHFLWEGTGEHYFYNSTTTYGILGWDDDTMLRSVDRLAALKVNRIRATLNWRVKDGRAWYENVFPTENFSFLLNPWVAEHPESLDNPGFDVTRFNVAHWRKYERLLRYAREKDMLVSVVFYTDGRRPGTDPFGKEKMGGEDEQRYYRYAMTRLASFSNVMWDVTNEYRLFRDDAWAEKMGTFIEENDPYAHLTSVHGHPDFRFRESKWADFAMYQNWDEHGGYDYMLRNRQAQEATGRLIPQVNEEYGYEDHYPVGWGESRVAPARSADTRRRLAWEISMAGCYQTTGERADTGTGWGPDTGGGWINGRGDDSMTLFKGYGYLFDFFTGFEWWKAKPHDELVSDGAYCLAEQGNAYVVYLPHGGNVTLLLDGGRYRTSWYNPRFGAWVALVDAHGDRWTSPDAPDSEDWVLFLRK